MGRECGEECLGGTLADSCTVIHTEVRQMPGGEGGEEVFEPWYVILPESPCAKPDNLCPT